MAKRIAFQFDDELEYQIKAINSAVDLFRGLPRQTEGIYRPERTRKIAEGDPIRNKDIVVGNRLLQNLRGVQLENQLFADETLAENNNFTVEMETGERVIIVMGALNVILSRVSRTLTKYYSYIA